MKTDSKLFKMILCMVSLFAISALPLGEALSVNTSNSNLQATTTAATIFSDYVSSEVGVHKIHDSRASWNAARNICLDEKAQLVVIESAAEEAMLMMYMRANSMRSVWIGVHDFFEKKQWTTIKGDRLYTLNHVRWGQGEPNGLGAGEHCVELKLTGMNDLACQTEMGFVCEKNGIEIRSS